MASKHRKTVLDSAEQDIVDNLDKAKGYSAKKKAHKVSKFRRAAHQYQNKSSEKKP